MATTDENSSVLDEVSSSAPPGTVLPPRNIREIVEKSAGYVARNGEAFERRLKQGTHSSKTSFVFEEDPYHAYYRWRVAEIKAGRGTHISAGRKEGQVSFAGREERKGPEKPADFEFSARVPTINSQDLEVLKKTALFAAKNGVPWMTALGQKEEDTRIIDQYRSLLSAAIEHDGAVQKKRIAEVEANVEDPFRILEKAKKRAEWVAHEESQKEVVEEKVEKKRIQYARIDWHDFVVVDTIIFTAADREKDLPAPPSLNDIQSASLEKKGAMLIKADHRIEESMPTFDDLEQFNSEDASTPQDSQQIPIRANSPPEQYNHSRPISPEGEESHPRTIVDYPDRERAARAAAQTNPPVKIRKDYVPGSRLRKPSYLTTSICPNCKQAIPNDEMAEHIRIELLDPQWREQSQRNKQRSITTNLSTANVSENLKRLASQRTDIFDVRPTAPTAPAPPTEEEERRKRVALQGPDGAPTTNPAQIGPNVDVQQQIRQLHEKYKTVDK